MFSAMKAMLEYLDKDASEMQFYFGTDHFETIWEKMIDKAFGIDNKDEYFPRTRWLLDYGDGKAKKPLIPDTIMIFNDKYYVIDSKFYRYGSTGNSDHLPNGSDINKQITYAEYIEKAKEIHADNIYNCFLMPFNHEANVFSTISEIKNIGEAIGEWRYTDKEPHLKKYERIQGVVIDVRFLMKNYICISDKQKKELADEIEKVDSRKEIVL